MVRNALPRRFGAPGLPELNASQVCCTSLLIYYCVSIEFQQCFGKMYFDHYIYIYIYIFILIF